MNYRTLYVLLLTAATLNLCQARPVTARQSQAAAEPPSVVTVGEGVVKLEHVNILWFDVCHLKCSFCGEISSR